MVKWWHSPFSANVLILDDSEPVESVSSPARSRFIFEPPPAAVPTWMQYDCDGLVDDNVLELQDIIPEVWAKYTFEWNSNPHRHQKWWIRWSLNPPVTLMNFGGNIDSNMVGGTFLYSASIKLTFSLTLIYFKMKARNWSVLSQLHVHVTLQVNSMHHHDH